MTESEREDLRDDIQSEIVSAEYGGYYKEIDTHEASVQIVALLVRRGIL